MLFMIRNAFINVKKEKRLYLPFLLVLVLLLYVLMNGFTLRSQIRAEQENQFGDYAAAVIIKNPVTEENAEKAAEKPASFIAEKLYAENRGVISDYYAFTEYNAWSDTLNPVPPSPDILSESPRIMLLNMTGSLSFSLISYTDISRSTHFRTGNKTLIEGRFAQTTTECNISRELAKYNNLSIGDIIDINYCDMEEYNDNIKVAADIVGSFSSPEFADSLYKLLSKTSIQLEIVGIFDESGQTVAYELDLIASEEVVTGVRTQTRKIYTNDTYSTVEGTDLVTYSLNETDGTGRLTEIDRKTLTRDELDELTYTVASSVKTDPSFPNVSSNQILTASSLTPGGGFDRGVLYTDDQESAMRFVEERVTSLPQGYMFSDSAAMYRTVRHLFNKTQIVYDRLFLFLGAAVIIFGFLIVFYVLKRRTYDIGVLRILGLSRQRTVAVITGEILITGVIAYIIAGGFYAVTFTPLMRAVYTLQGAMLRQSRDVDLNFIKGNPEDLLITTTDDRFLTAAMDKTESFFSSISLSSIFFSLLALLIFISFVFLFALRFIARYEPMKIMMER